MTKCKHPANDTMIICLLKFPDYNPSSRASCTCCMAVALNRATSRNCLREFDNTSICSCYEFAQLRNRCSGHCLLVPLFSGIAISNVISTLIWIIKSRWQLPEDKVCSRVTNHPGLPWTKWFKGYGMFVAKTRKVGANWSDLVTLSHWHDFVLLTVIYPELWTLPGIK